MENTMRNEKLTIQELEYVQNEVKFKRKSMPGAYSLAIFLGPIGIHRTYFGKLKSGVAKAFLTLLTGATLGAVLSTMTGTPLTAQTVGAALRYNAVLGILLIGLTAINVTWSIVDLFLIPSWVKEFNNRNERIATKKAIQARYVSEHLLKDQLSSVLIEQVKKEVEENISVEMNKMLDDYKEHNLSLNKYKIPSLPKDDLNTPKDFEAVVKEDIEYVDDKTEYADAENQIDISTIKPDDIVEEYKNEIEPIPAPLSEIINDPLIMEDPVIKDGLDDYNLSKLSQVDRSLKINEDCKLELIKDDTSIDDITEPSIKNNVEEYIESINVNQAIINNEGVNTVKGYIVGNVDQDKQEVVTINFKDDTNLALADLPNETDRTKMLFVQLPWDSQFRDNIGLKSNPSNINKEAVISGSLQKYFGKPGLKQPTKITLTDNNGNAIDGNKTELSAKIEDLISNEQ